MSSYANRPRVTPQEFEHHVLGRLAHYPGAHFNENELNMVKTAFQADLAGNPHFNNNSAGIDAQAKERGIQAIREHPIGRGLQPHHMDALNHVLDEFIQKRSY